MNQVRVEVSTRTPISTTTSRVAALSKSQHQKPLRTPVGHALNLFRGKTPFWCPKGKAPCQNAPSGKKRGKKQTSFGLMRRANDGRRTKGRTWGQGWGLTRSASTSYWGQGLLQRMPSLRLRLVQGNTTGHNRKSMVEKDPFTF